MRTKTPCPVCGAPVIVARKADAAWLCGACRQRRRRDCATCALDGCLGCDPMHCADSVGGLYQREEE